MKITKRTVTKEEIEVSFPHYSTDNICHWYKVISEDKMIKIFSNSYSEYCSIDLTQYCIYNAFDERNSLYLEYVRFVKIIQPNFFVLENVKGLLNLNNGFFKEDIINRFTNLGYNVTFSVLKALMTAM
jgi:hypothetical protein